MPASMRGQVVLCELTREEISRFTRAPRATKGPLEF
jgi:hypothetical protein